MDGFGTNGRYHGDRRFRLRSACLQPWLRIKTRQPGVWERWWRSLAIALKSRRIQVGEWDDPIEACFDRGWTDGLPVVPPTDERILRMLSGTNRRR